MVGSVVGRELQKSLSKISTWTARYSGFRGTRARARTHDKARQGGQKRAAGASERTGAAIEGDGVQPAAVGAPEKESAKAKEEEGREEEEEEEEEGRGGAGGGESRVAGTCVTVWPGGTSSRRPHCDDVTCPPQPHVSRPPHAADIGPAPPPCNGRCGRPARWGPLDGGTDALN